MASQRKVVEKGKNVDKEGPASPQARVDGKTPIDLVALLKDFTQHFQVLPDKESSGKSGSAKSGEVSAFKALFQAPLGTEIHDKRQGIDELYHRMRGILHNPKYMDSALLSPGDEIAVRDFLKYHPDCEQITGPGIAYIKIQKIYDDKTRCFRVVHVDGTEIDFSSHQRLKVKAAKECPEYRDVPHRASQRNGAYTRF